MLRTSLTAIASVFASVVLGVSAHAESTGSESFEYLTGLRSHFDRVAAHEDIVGFAAAVIENGEPVFVYTHGETAAGSGREVSETTLFRAASVSKTFTGTLFALLEADGQLDLDTPIPSDVMTLSGDRSPTIEEVLSHRTGLPPNAYDNMLEAGRNVSFIRDRLSGVDLICPVGSCYTYQNVAFASVEALAEDVTGQSYDELLTRELFERIGMPTASLGAEELTEGENWAAPHRGWRRSHNRAGDPETYYDRMPSAAGVNLSLSDMIVWAQAQLGARDGLPETVRARAHERITSTRRETRRLGDLSDRVSATWYGLGWRVYDWGDRTLVMHSGYLSGYGAQIVLEPETGFAFVALWNSDNRPAWWLWPAVMDMRTGASDGNRWLRRLNEGN